MSTSPTSSDGERSPTYEGFGFDSISVSSDGNAVVLVANPDGLVALANLCLRLACQEGLRSYVHLLPTLQLAPESQSLRVVRSDEGLLPDGRAAPSWEARLTGWDGGQVSEEGSESPWV